MKPVKLSVSSFKLLQACEKKYWHHKVAGTKHDSDYEEGDFLGFGKAFHEVLEKTNHTDWNEKLLMEAMINHSVNGEERMLLEVMLKKYVQYHKASGIKVVKCELGIETNMTVLYIDAIGISFDATGKPVGWWIIDLKTASTHSESILAQLPNDSQMNHYSSFADDVEIAVEEIKGLPFLGCRYRQVIKSKAGTMHGLEKGVRVLDIEIPVEVLSTEEFKKLFSTVHDRAVQLHQGEAPVNNFQNCMSYFKPCQFFSQCHGSIFTKAKNKVRVHTLDTIQNGDLL
jgi:hypothetical protein